MKWTGLGPSSLPSPRYTLDGNALLRMTGHFCFSQDQGSVPFQYVQKPLGSLPYFRYVAGAPMTARWEKHRALRPG